MHTEAGDVELGGVEIASDVERFETAAEIGGAEIADVIECDMCRDIGTSWAEELVDDRPHVGVFGSVGEVFDEFAGIGRNERVRGVDVSGTVVAEGANEGEAIGHRSETRKMFGDLEAGDVGGDGLELTTIFGWSVGFEVEGFHVAGAAPEPKDDQGFGGFEGET